ncbi:MAG: FtsX-like permease family protein [Desulfovibrio sp.]|nr:FtsX-like permease family protein [Desulfovibrio sp.]
MNIITIPLRCLRQKGGRSAALLSVFLLGVAAITALNNVSSSVAEGFEKKLSAFGANIAITPKRETLQISYGGIPLGNATVDSGYIPLAQTMRAIEGISLKDRISVVAPKLAGLASFAKNAHDTTELVPLVGVNFDSEVDLKQFWHVRGSIPGIADMHAPDPLVQRMEEQHAKHVSQAEGSSATSASTSASMPAPGTVQRKGQAGAHEEPAHPREDIPLERHLLAGASVAERLHLTPGQTIWLNGGQFLVEGVLQPTGSDDDNVLFAHLAEAQKLFHAPDAASFIEVAALCSGCPIEDIVAELGAALPGQDIRALRQVVAQRMYSISFAQNMALVVTVVILFSACVMVVMSMLVSVNERRKEIGLLRAVGFSRQAVFFIFAAEALVIGFLAGAAGYAAGYFAGGKVLVAMQLEASGYPAFSLAAMLGYGLMASALAVLAAAFPACKAARANPAEALTSL